MVVGHHNFERYRPIYHPLWAMYFVFKYDFSTLCFGHSLPEVAGSIPSNVTFFSKHCFFPDFFFTMGGAMPSKYLLNII